jgi:hypothetical protein
MLLLKIIRKLLPMLLLFVIFIFNPLFFIRFKGDDGESSFLILHLWKKYVHFFNVGQITAEKRAQFENVH